MSKGEMDLWHFVCDDDDNSWKWRRMSPDGEEVAHSSYSFQSFNACVSDAELAGFVNTTSALRRVRASELMAEQPRSGIESAGHADRRRRSREYHS